MIGDGAGGMWRPLKKEFVMDAKAAWQRKIAELEIDPKLQADQEHAKLKQAEEARRFEQQRVVQWIPLLSRAGRQRPDVTPASGRSKWKHVFHDGLRPDSPGAST